MENQHIVETVEDNHDQEAINDMIQIEEIMAQKGEYNREAYKARKQHERQQLFAMADSQFHAITNDTQSLTQYLSLQGKLGYTSVYTTLLILAQEPKATMIRTYDGWRQLGRTPRKGSGIKVFEVNGEYQREDGSPGVAYSIKSVFDISKTDGESIAPRSQPGIRSLVKAVATESPVPIKLIDTLGADRIAEYSKDDNVIFVKRNSPAGELFTALVVELARSNGLEGFHVLCSTNIVCHHYGIPPIVIGEIPAWVKELSAPEKKIAFAMIRQAACDIMERIDRNLFNERQMQRSEPERESR